tara:strand:- start:67 stop:879 length:813 start_codon:yes stop_codon:yes gene_type:complete
MTIFVSVVGGLGNQLFTIFAGIAYSLEHKVPFKLVSTPNKRELYYNTFLATLKGFVLPDTREVRDRNSYIEPNFHYNKIPYDKDFVLNGYWQSYKYFTDHLDSIMRLTKINMWKEAVKDKYNYTEDSISIHFRIGDYTLYPNHHNILDIDYYISALNQIIELDSSVKRVIVFGEACDSNKILERVNILKEKFDELEFEVINHTIPDYSQMMIMSNCKHNIIANSSFSLMAAYLNMNKDKNVLYPSKWFGPKNMDKNTNDIPEEGWFRISV